MRLGRPRLSYANVMSTLALFVALGGTSYAVARNSVGTAQLRTNAVTSVKVKDRSLQAADLALSARIGVRGPRGVAGPQGLPGEFIAMPEAWRPLELVSGWDRYDTFHEQPAFRKDRQGQVHLRGLITLTTGVPTASSVIATLPAGYTPARRNIFPVSSGEPAGLARVFLDADGKLTREGTAALGDKDYTSLGGISFWPE